MMLIRPSVSKDASSLALLSLEVWSTTYLRRGINAFFAEYALEEFSRPGFEVVLCDPFEILLVAEKNRLVQGCIRLALNSNCGLEGTGVAEIKTLYVRPRHHHRGIGKALLRAGLAALEAADNTSPWLMVNAQNQEAMGFYTAQGFERGRQTQLLHRRCAIFKLYSVLRRLTVLRAPQGFARRITRHFSIGKPRVSGQRNFRPAHRVPALKKDQGTWPSNVPSASLNQTQPTAI